jgi:hypothetical protein
MGGGFGKSYKSPIREVDSSLLSLSEEFTWAGEYRAGGLLLLFPFPLSDSCADSMSVFFAAVFTYSLPEV